jgi:hypothetical protein
MKLKCFTSLTAAAIVAGSVSVSAEEVSSLGEMFSKGDANFFLRLRYESVDQEGFAENAVAPTLLSKITLSSATYKGFGFVVEGAGTINFDDDYNSTVNGNTGYPVIADPELVELNQAYISYKNDTFGFKGGRQGINLDNQRFIGTVGFRQNDQTYDAVMATTTLVKGLSASYGYVWNVNRIFGNEHPVGDFDSDIHMFNAGYTVGGVGKLTAYGYLLDLTNAAALSSKTFGARFAGKQKFSDAFNVGYELEYASQSDHGANPADYSADYYHFAGTGSASGFTVGVGYELLGSDSGTSFKTPLATLHKFNGWADKFLATPAGGLSDLYVSAAFKVPGKGALGGLLLKGVYHTFKSDVGSVDYGSELDLLISKKINKYVTASVKAAFYNADSFATDTDKIWITLQGKF